jgi:hygromycin-B 4-O-kinase
MTVAHLITLQQAREFLTRYYGSDPADVEHAGEGAWSRCFGFRTGDDALVIRFGRYVSDFRTDQLAWAYAAPSLPIPEVLDIGEAYGGYYAISRRAFGTPLEQLRATEWLATLPSVVDMFEALRTTDISSTQGFGGWGESGDTHAPHARWSDHLLAVGDDTPDRRTYGWRAKLAQSPEAQAAFAWGYELLKRIVDDRAPRNLLHCDLINRNVLAKDGRVTGVFDWGCSRYGDHLYDLAWLEFWSPWHPNMDVRELRAALEQRWHAAGKIPTNLANRVLACYLHIGLDHIAYNAHTGDQINLAGTIARMRALVPDARQIR